ncbi:Peptidase S8/S53, subtilisin/kexin/sedolisin [Fusarium austroafricanum]|uniref:Peptidase S8/S53, subtilisin/kexin/sedolisin n=1 Tax=Fusarium austroafricanum TaxID=2364996 RepID=A0A8H4KNJ5_9HYPO|nr:Peptidase S8/S53, subtilisin/kexin/sedolisin [Fusarium austroafricanum]
MTSTTVPSKNAKRSKDAKESDQDNLGTVLKIEWKQKLDSLGQSIFDELVRMYDEQKDSKGSAITRIKAFLTSDHKDQYDSWDDCVRWRILFSAMRTDGSREVADEISNIIIDFRPMFAFMSLGQEKNNPSTGLTTFCINRSWCKNKTAHKTDEYTIPFHFAAKKGRHNTVKRMINNIKETFKSVGNSPDHPLSGTTLLKLVQARCLELDNIPLALAQRAFKTPLETLEELLKVPGIAEGDKSLKMAIENGWDSVVEAFLKVGIETPANDDLIREALKRLDDKVELGNVGASVCSKAENCRLEIVKSLVDHADSPDALSETVVEEIIKRDLTEVWEKWREKAGNDSVREIYLWPLHMAVLYEKVEFVKIFVNDYPEALSREAAVPGPWGTEKKDKYPLWYNNRKWDDKEGKGEWKVIAKPSAKQGNRTTIRNLIVTKMVHELDMDKLPDILHRSNEPFDDLCFDISKFNSAAYRISDIVDSLILQDKNSSQNDKDERGMHRYESTLKYVAFPPLDKMVPDREAYRENMNLQRGHDEVFRVLNWLLTKKVTKIIKLIVPDRLVNPHDDYKMAEFVKRFKIEVLDWKVLDLSISIFNFDDHLGKAEITELYLYSSGKRAAIDHWFDKENGVEKLSQLKKQRLSDDASQKITSVDPSELPWYPSPSVADLSKIASRLSSPLADWLTKLAEFIKQRNSRPGKIRHKPTKVAILDNGVLSISPISKQVDAELPVTISEERTGSEAISGNVLNAKPTDTNSSPEQRKESVGNNSLWSRIKAGRSFVDGNLNFSPWQFPSDPHGTQMANLICAIDPSCEIYVARVAEDAFGINAKNVAKAIQWAMDENVDIISMSFVLGEDPDRVMEKKIIEAGKAGIVMTCSTHDEGSRIQKAYPASSMGDCIALLVLAACDEYGKLLRDIEPSLYSYMLRGQNVPAGVVEFIQSSEKISGSSVATALAAGLCSLILTCARLADPNRQFDTEVKIDKENKDHPNSRLHIVREHLDAMVSNSKDHSNYVLLEKFGGIAEPAPGEGMKPGSLSKVGNVATPPVTTVLKQRFGMKG